MIEKLKFLIDEIELFANAHANVERFAFEFEDQIDPLIQRSTLHPYMFVSPIDGYAVNQAMTQIGLRIKVLDIIEMQDRSNVKDILDNSLKVLQDFIAEFGEMNKDLLVEMPTISALNDYTPNYTAGYFIDANFYIIKRNNCDNFGGGTPPDFCKDATVNILDNNGSPLGSVTVPSGGSDTFVVNELPIDTDFIIAAYNQGDPVATAFVTVTGTVNDVIIDGLTSIVMRKNGSIISSLTNVTTGDIISFEFNQAPQEGVILIEGNYA